MVMEFVGVKTCDENATSSHLAELPGVHIAGIDNAGGMDTHIQRTVQSAPFHGGFYNFCSLRDSDSHPGHIYGRDGNPEPKRPQPQLGRRRCSGRVLLEAAPVTRIKFLLGLLRKALSLVIDGILFIVSMWFLIGLIGFALLIVIAFVYGVVSLF